MFWALLAVEVVGLVALFATLAFFQEGQVWERQSGWGALCKIVGIGSAGIMIVVFGFRFTGSLSALEIALLLAPFLLLVLMFAALVDQPHSED